MKIQDRWFHLTKTSQRPWAHLWALENHQDLGSFSHLWLWDEHHENQQADASKAAIATQDCEDAQLSRRDVILRTYFSNFRGRCITTKTTNCVFAPDFCGTDPHVFWDLDRTCQFWKEPSGWTANTMIKVGTDWWGHNFPNKIKHYVSPSNFQMDSFDLTRFVQTKS